jgi:hypothetical protein
VKKLLVAVISFQFITNSAFAVQSVTKVSPVSQSFTINLSGGPGDEVSSFVVSGNSLVIAGTTENSKAGITTGYVASYKSDGTKEWELPIGIESVATTITKDKLGNIYAVGASVSAPPPAQPKLPDPSTINPDNVNVDPVTTPTNSLTNLTTWEISSTGALMQTYSSPFGEVFYPSAAVYSTQGITISGSTSTKNFSVTMGSNGTFGVITHPKIQNPPAVQIFSYGTNQLHYFLSKGPIFGIPSWKPKKTYSVLIEYSKLGSKKIADYFPDSVVCVGFDAKIGFIALTNSASGYGFSIVKPLI